jgi:class 3 adenylate cyclase
MGARGVPYRSAADVVSGRLRPGELDGRVVLVGATDPALGDAHVTPVDKGGRMPGVFIHANALNTLLTESYLLPSSRRNTVAWMFALAFVAAVATLSVPLWAAAPVTLGAVALRLVVGIARFQDGVVPDLVYPTLAAGTGFVVALGVRYAGEVRARRRMGDVLSQYVPPAVARQLLDRGSGRALPSGTITFLFTDVVGSTVAWEAHPKEMSQAMRLHDAIIERAVQAAEGALVRPRGEGDSRFAVFVAPSGAVRAAADIAASMAEERWPTPSPVRIRMALHTGEAQLWEGDYYGSPPNRCARLRSAAEPGQILLSSTAASAASRDLPEGTTLRPLGPVKLKDFDEPEEPHELVISGRVRADASQWVPALVEPTATD